MIEQPEFEVDYLKISIAWAEGYANDVQGIEGLVVRSKAYRWCIVDLYKRFVSSGELRALEDDNDFDVDEVFKEYDVSIKRELSIFCYFMNYIFGKYFIS